MFNADNIHPIINLEFIEKYISDEDIFRKYCSNFQEINKKFCSELRKDRNPSCYIYIKSNNRLAYKDFGSGEHYSSIEYVMKKYNVLFKEALNIISCDFKLFKVSYADLKGQYPLGMENVSDGLIKHNKAIIHISPREWNLIDNNYWGKYYITLDLLNQYNVVPCQKVFLYTKNREFPIEFSYKESNPIYAYKFIKPGGEISYKIYFPLADKKYKWLFSGGSSDDIEGYDQLPWLGDILILTKSLKDCMCYNLIGYPAISLQGEANKLEYEFLNKLYKRFNKIIVNYDNDEQGIKSTNSLVRKYNLDYFYIDDAKDLSDYLVNNSLEDAKIIINNKIKCLIQN